MSPSFTVKTVFKRGVLVAAANWQATAIQFVADSTVKLLLSIPVVGGVLLVALVLGRDLPELVGEDLRSSLTGVAAALTSEPVALAAFLVSFAVVGLSGSVLLFLTKGGTVSVLAQGERDAGPVELPPLRFALFSTAARFTLDRFHDGCVAVFPRYLRLGLVLIGVYVLSGAAFLAVLFGDAPAAPESTVGWTVRAGLATTGLVVWITALNFFYGLVQMIVVLDDTSVRRAARRAIGFVRAEPRLVLSVFGLVLALVAGATVISIVATTSLGLIAFVPLVGLAVVQLQLLAWLFRGLVFQYLELGALGAYVALYRQHRLAGPDGAAGPASELPRKP